MSIFLLILGLLLFVGLVVVHEFGHMMAARRNGVDVEEFGIGFPPRLKIFKRHKGTIFTLNLLPLGGFVKLKGEHDADTQKGSYGAAKLSAKIKIMTAGVVMNLAAAILLLTLAGWVGMPRLLDNQFTIKSDTKTIRQDVLVGYVEPDSPAAKAGLQTRDRLVAIGPDKNIENAGSVVNQTKNLAGQTVSITYKRAGQEITKQVTLRTAREVEASKKTGNTKGYLGVAPAEYVLRRSTWSAPVVAVGLTGQFTTQTLKGLGGVVADLFHGNGKAASENVSGPVGIFVVLKDGSLLGFQFVLLIIAFISLTLAIFNVLPIPALDGGRLFVTLVFHGLKKPLTKKTEDMIHGTGFVLLMVLFVLITVVDVRRFF